MGINSIVAVNLTSLEILLGTANLLLILIAVFLLIRIKRLEKKDEQKEKRSELTGIADIKPEEFKLERFEINKNILQHEKNGAEQPVSGLPEINQAEILLMDSLKLEDDLPEEPQIMTMGIEEPEVKQPEAPVIPEFSIPTTEVHEKADVENRQPEILVQSQEAEPQIMPLENAEKPKRKRGRKKKEVTNAIPKKKVSKRKALF